MRAAGVAVLAGALAGCLGGRDTPPAMAPEVAARVGADIEARLAAEPSIGPGRVRVEMREGTAILQGSVRGMGALQCAIRNAELVDGVQSVADMLVLEPGPRTVTCLAPAPR